MTWLAIEIQTRGRSDAVHTLQMVKKKISTKLNVFSLQLFEYRSLVNATDQTTNGTLKDPFWRTFPCQTTIGTSDISIITDTIQSPLNKLNNDKRPCDFWETQPETFLSTLSSRRIGVHRERQQRHTLVNM